MESKESAEEFMSRWSRRKQQAREEQPVPLPQSSADAGPAPELPSVEELGMDSDYRDFFHPKVKEAVRRTALKKLFSDPHFNIMDGLDTYIDDYSINEPIPAEMLAGLKQAQNILAWAKEDQEAVAKREAAAAAAAAAAAQGDTAPVQIAEASAESGTVPAEPAEESVEVPSRPADDGPQNA